MRLIAVLVAGLTLLAGTTACDPLADPPAGTPANNGQQLAGDAAAASAALAALPVAKWAAMTGYSRERFHHWTAHGSGCDTREVVLRRDGTDVATGKDCTITSGTWFSVYDGKSFTNPRDLDIDHMVPLANAWRTGAAQWTDEQREAFANDLERPQLLAVSSSTNRSKGDQDPSEWKPPRRDYWCTYAQSWITVKSYWKLSVTSAEKDALAEMLDTCR